MFNSAGSGRLRVMLLALIVAAVSACSDSSDGFDTNPDLGLEVRTASGPLLGQDSDRAVAWEWLGIPFAAAPVNALRWRAPAAPEPWQEPRSSDSFGPVCPQFDFFGSYVGEEDCLYLNVWRPPTQERDLPVMVWVHGGSNNSGGTDWQVYGGARLAERANMVVVTVQYRLGALGWLYYPPLQDGNELDNSGNFGTLDLVASLRWVQENIEAFGGDSNNVTITGESAGGADILSLMLGDSAQGLFHKAIVQSAGGSVTSTVAATARAEQFTDELITLVNPAAPPQTDAERAQFLRSLDAQTLKQATTSVGAIFGDDEVIPAAGYSLFESGDFPNRVPLLIGTNQDEYKLYTNPLGFDVLPDASDELRAAVGRYVSDAWRVTGADDIATRLVGLGDYPAVYVYRFNWGSPDELGRSPLPVPFGATGGAHHAAEVPFMLGNEDTFLIEAYTGLLYTEANAVSRTAMADIMIAYWSSFARSSDPNEAGLATWEPWSNEDAAFKAITLDVSNDDNLPLLGEDRTVWTRERVYQEARENIPEPTLTELLPFLDNWFARGSAE